MTYGSESECATLYTTAPHYITTQPAWPPWPLLSTESFSEIVYYTLEHFLPQDKKFSLFNTDGLANIKIAI